MNYLQYNKTGSLTVYLPNKPDSNSLTGSILSANGALMSSASLAWANVNTFITSPANKGVMSCSVASATGIVGKEVYWIEDEEIRISSISGSNITFLRPLSQNHPISSSFFSGKVTATIPPISIIGRNFQLNIDYKSGSLVQNSVQSIFDVSRYSVKSGLTERTLFAAVPTLMKEWPSGILFSEVRDSSWDWILDRLQSRTPAAGLAGALDLTRLHTIAFRLFLLEMGTGITGDEYKELLKVFDAEFDAKVPNLAVDRDGNGSVLPSEAAFAKIRLIKSS